MDDASRNAVLAAAEELFDQEQLYKLASSVGEARSRRRLRFWQEQMLAQLSQRSGIDVTSKTRFIAAFKGTKKRYASPKPDRSAAGVLKTMRDLWSNREARIQWIQWAARDLSKTGSLHSYAQSYRALAKFLPATEVILLYESLRDTSHRAESEWRDEFLSYFKRTVKDEDLPVTMDDQHWEIETAGNPPTLPIDPFTGLPRKEKESMAEGDETGLS